ncbi:MAG TPA: hypothetical protein VE844_13040 [Gammaproteobacteria bacterium]|jgi:hypothetical protein|nr:hypothetical protein [Gammaproteobacteria bacterium]
MANFKQQFFLQFASLGLTELISEYRTRYEPKKGDRFNVDGITYEIGPAKITSAGVEFEVSSKIPQEELSSKADMVRYFEAVKGLMLRASSAPSSIDMENIVREISEEETKERDYVKLRYCIAEQTLFDDHRVNEELKRLQENPAMDQPPAITGVNTLAGRVVLSLLKRNMQQQAKTIMDNLIKANEETRQQLRTTVVGAPS